MVINDLIRQKENQDYSILPRVKSYLQINLVAMSCMLAIQWQLTLEPMIKLRTLPPYL